MKLAKALSQRIKALRQASGLSQQEVAMRGDLSLSLVAKLEQGKKADPRASTLLSLATALGVRPGELLNDLFPPTADDTEAGVAESHVNGQAESDKAKGEPGKDRKKKKSSKKKKKT